MRVWHSSRTGAFAGTAPGAKHPVRERAAIWRHHDHVDPKLVIMGATLVGWMFIVAWTIVGLSGVGVIFPVTP